MSDIGITYRFIPEGVTADQLRKQIEASLGKPIDIKFKVDSSGFTGKNSPMTRALSSFDDFVARSGMKTTGKQGAKNLISLQKDYVKAQMQLDGIEQKSADRAAKQSAAKEKSARQEALNYKYIKREAQDYFNSYQKNITKNTELNKKFNEFISSDPKQFKDSLDARTKLNELKEAGRDAGVEIESLGQRIKRLFGQHFDTALVMVGINALRQALQQVYQNVVQLDKAVVDLQIATGGSRSDMQALLSNYSKLGQEIGATTLEVAQSSDTFLRQGKTLAETDTLIRNSMMLSKLGQISSEEASTSLTSAMKGYKVSVEDSLGIVDKLTAVDLKAATSAGDLAIAMQQTAVGANIAGLSMDKLIGQLTVMLEVTQQGPEQIGNFQKTMLARMSNIKAGNFIDPESGEILNYWGIAA